MFREERKGQGVRERGRARNRSLTTTLYPESSPNSYRLCDGAMNAISPLLSDKTKIEIEKSDVLVYLREDHPKLEKFSKTFMEGSRAKGKCPSRTFSTHQAATNSNRGPGGCIGVVKAEGLSEGATLNLPIWLTDYSSSALLKKEHKHMLSVLLGAE